MWRDVRKSLSLFRLGILRQHFHGRPFETIQFHILFVVTACTARSGYYAFNVRRVCNHYGCMLRIFILIESEIYIHDVTLLNIIIYFGEKGARFYAGLECAVRLTGIFVLIIVCIPLCSVGRFLFFCLTFPFFSCIHTCSTCDSCIGEISLFQTTNDGHLPCSLVSNFQTILCVCTFGLCVRYFFFRLPFMQQPKPHRRTFQFTTFVSYRFAWVSFLLFALANVSFSFFTSSLLLTLSHQKIFIHRRNSVKHIATHSVFDTKQWGGSNVQSLFSVRLFLYHFIYLKLLWLVFIDADAAAAAAAVHVVAVRFYASQPGHSQQFTFVPPKIRATRIHQFFQCRFYPYWYVYGVLAERVQCKPLLHCGAFIFRLAQSQRSSKMCTDDMNGWIYLLLLILPHFFRSFDGSPAHSEWFRTNMNAACKAYENQLCPNQMPDDPYWIVTVAERHTRAHNVLSVLTHHWIGF